MEGRADETKKTIEELFDEVDLEFLKITDEELNLPDKLEVELQELTCDD